MNEINDNYWHRQPWIWFIIALLGITILASFGMLFIASSNPPELVVESYANIDELTAKTRAQDKQAADLQLGAVVQLDRNAIVVELQSERLASYPDSIIVYTRNSTRAELDSRTELNGRDGFYGGSIDLPDNAYDLHIEDPEGAWRLSKRLVGRPARTALTAFRPGE